MVDEVSVPDIISANLFGDVIVVIKIKKNKIKNNTQIDYPIRDNYRLEMA